MREKFFALFNSNSKQIKLLLFCLAVVSVFVLRHYQWYDSDQSPNLNIISGDGYGYYLYLPKLLIDHDLDYEDQSNRFIVEVEGEKVNKCFIGPAVCMLPSFLVAYLIASFTDAPLDGYSFPFQLAVSLGAVVYLMLGLWFISRLLANLKFKKSSIIAVLLLIFFGSNLFLVSAFNSSMSHAYSFCWISIFLWAFHAFLAKKDLSKLMLSGLAVGMIMILRPTNGLVLLLLPFLFAFHKQSELKKLIQIRNVLVFLFFALLPIALQSGIWYLQTQKLLVWSYPNEGFYFDDPQIWEVLFGFRSGWFIYTPLALIALFGLFPIYKKSRLQFASLLVFWASLIYLTAAWWNYFFGGSFGMRPLVDFYAVIGILLAYLIDAMGRRLKKLMLIPALLIVSLNLIQHHQYFTGILSGWDMNFEKYKAVFGRLHKGDFKMGGNHDILPYRPNKQLILEEKYAFEEENDFQTIYDPLKKSHVLDHSGKEYHFTLKRKLGPEAIGAQGNFLELDFSRYEVELNNSQNALIVVEMKDSLKQTHFYYWTFLNELPAEKKAWKRYTYQFLLPSAKSRSDYLHIYIRNQDQSAFYLDDVFIRLYSL